MSLVDDIKVAFHEAMDKLDSRLGGMEKALHAQTKHLAGGTVKRRSRLKFSGKTNAAKEDVSVTFAVPQGEQWTIRSQAFVPTNPVATMILRLLEGQLASVAAMNPQDAVFSTGGIAAAGFTTVLCDILLREGVTYTIMVLAGEENVPWSLSMDVLKEHLEPDESTTVGTDD